MVKLDKLIDEELQNDSSLPPRTVLPALKEITVVQCISVPTFRPTMKNHELQMYSFLTVYVRFKVHIFLTTTTMLSPHYLTPLNSLFFPLQTHRGCTPQSKEMKSWLHGANDNIMLKAQNFSRSVNSQQNPLQVGLPTMLKPWLASICLHRLSICLTK